MKRRTAVLGLVLTLAGGAALAGDHGGGQYGKRGDPEARLQRMQQHLGLSDAQVEQIREIHSSDLSRPEKREQVHSVLSDEQRSIIEAHRAERGGRRGGPPPQESEDLQN